MYDIDTGELEIYLGYLDEKQLSSSVNFRELTSNSSGVLLSS